MTGARQLLSITNQEKITMKTTRNNILYYSSTALIITSAISLIMPFFVSIVGGLLAAGLTRSYDLSGYFLGTLGASLFLVNLLAILIHLPFFYAGFIGRKNADNPQMGGRLYTFGIIMLVLFILFLLKKLALFTLVQFVIVALYTIGAYELKTGKVVLSQYFGQVSKVDMDNEDRDDAQ